MRVDIVTLSRSDYASTRPVIQAALADSKIEARVIAGGSHMLARYGHTIDELEADGIKVWQRAEFLSESDDSPAELAHAYGRAVAVFVSLFSRSQPDRVFVLGDRWEMLAVASAASMLRLPIIHHSGGDITQGSADNQIRYAISCLSHLHLTALPEHRDRLVAMGEEPWRVTVTGEPALTELAAYGARAGDIRAALGIEPKAPFVLATFHPTSFETCTPQEQAARFLACLDQILETIVLTAPNPDASSDIFYRMMKQYASENPRVKLVESLGADRYYAAMAEANFMIGNSSSGLWEAPSFGLPVINIGVRQQGRVCGKNVLHVPLDVAQISDAIQKLSHLSGRKKFQIKDNPYVRDDTLALILDSLKAPYDTSKLLAKNLVDPLKHAGHH